MKDTLKWVKRYFETTDLIASWSKDPRTKIGAIVVAPDGHIVAQGYNGFPRGIEDSEARLNDRPTKHKLVVHAEANTLLSSLYNGVPVKDYTMYINSLCCSECAKIIIQSGIKKVYMIKRDDAFWDESHNLSLDMFKECGIEYKVFTRKEIQEM